MHVAGGDHDGDRRKLVPDKTREIEAVDLAWHADVGEQNVDLIRFGSDDLKRPGRVRRFDPDATVFRQNVDGDHPQKRLVVGDQYYQRTIRDF
jgi:hypothetical protein